MTAPIRIPVRQGSPEWLAARREHITATALPILLGISPWKCEQDLADEITSGNGQESTLKMRVGNALEDLILAAYSEKTGRKARRVRGLWESSRIPWAAASPDATAAGRLVELKWSGSRSRFAGELPDDVAAQVQWQLMVAESPVADVAALTVGDDDVRVFEVPADAALQGHMVTIAADFRRRLEAGGPFAQSNDSVKRKYPRDSGAEIQADTELIAMVRHLMAVRVQKDEIKRAEDAGEAAIKSRMGEIATVRGTGWHVTWKRTKDRVETDWKSLATSLLTQLPEPDRAAVVGLHQMVGEGFRPFRIWVDKED